MVLAAYFSYNTNNNILHEQPFYPENCVCRIQCNKLAHTYIRMTVKIVDRQFTGWGVSTHYFHPIRIIPAQDSHLDKYRFDVICNHIIYNKFEAIHLIIILLRSPCICLFYWIEYAERLCILLHSIIYRESGMSCSIQYSHVYLLARLHHWRACSSRIL